MLQVYVSHTFAVRLLSLILVLLYFDVNLVPLLPYRARDINLLIPQDISHSLFLKRNRTVILFEVITVLYVLMFFFPLFLAEPVQTLKIINTLITLTQVYVYFILDYIIEAYIIG